ncbi:DUF2277 domain-containing protein [Phytomonospora sp. NPDC050363]|uniref:DUF2277 domain-containing protein n=1 Tax=Phytomonospora sp. NPDC050363 TaxID=3155642 RepID=UPI0033EE11D5
MCRNIHRLYNIDPPVTDEEVHDAALQYVRKVSGSSKPSAANQEAFEQAVTAVAEATSALLAALVSPAPPLSREEMAAKAKARSERRFGAPAS